MEFPLIMPLPIAKLLFACVSLVIMTNNGIPCQAVRHPDRSLDICISNQLSYQCGARSGAPTSNGGSFSNQAVSGFYDKYRDERLLVINTDQVFVTDPFGSRTKKLELPGRYKLIFANIEVKRDLDYLVADLRIVIKPTIGQASFEIFAMPECDSNSHLVYMDGLQYCRYCDLCDITRRLEENLVHQNIFDPLQNTEEFNCRHLDNREVFRLSRTISLPNTDAFASQYEDKLDSKVKKHLDNGNGKIVAHLRLLSKTAVDNPQTHQFKSSCIIRCINGRGTANLGQCRQNCEHDIAKDLSESVGEICRASQGYLPGYQLAGCYEVEFDFLAANITQNIDCSN